MCLCSGQLERMRLAAENIPDSEHVFIRMRESERRFHAFSTSIIHQGMSTATVLSPAPPALPPRQRPATATTPRRRPTSAMRLTDSEANVPKSSVYAPEHRTPSEVPRASVADLKQQCSDAVAACVVALDLLQQRLHAVNQTDLSTLNSYVLEHGECVGSPPEQMHLWRLKCDC
jgi:hypothetical protein